jgi:hypothetical protein
MKHTPGLLTIDEPFRNEVYIVDDNGRSVAFVNHDDDERKEQAGDAARLVAAWNACAGISTEALEAGELQRHLAAAERLAEACEALSRRDLGWWYIPPSRSYECRYCFRRAQERENIIHADDCASAELDAALAEWQAANGDAT